jgi:phosphatidyl-myo-inositol dimannoside synthase
MPKILLPTIDYPPARGGVARYIGAILQSFPGDVTMLPIKHMKLDRLAWKLLWRSRGYEAIWVHHVLPIGTAAMIVKRLVNKPYVVFLHGLDFDLARRNPWKRWLLKNVLMSARQVVANSEALAKEIQSFAALANTPTVVYPPLADDFVRAAQDSAKTKVNLHKLAELAVGVAHQQTPMLVSSRSLGPETSLRLLTVARLVERKGHLKVIEALKQLPDVSYTIVGDGPMLKQINEAIVASDLGHRVTVKTDVTDDQLPDEYRSADIFVMPTTKTHHDREGFGIVYLEAQMFGLPVIATKQPGVDEAVRDGEGGVLIGDNLEELVAAIQRLKNQTIRSTLGARGRARVSKQFTREQQMYKLRSVL